MAKTVAEYLARQPPQARRVLKRVRSVLKGVLPGAEEVISYGIPAYRVNRRIAVYFAGWKEHFSLYPISRELEKQLPGAALSHKGTVRFPYDAPVPVRLITRIAKHRAKELAKK